MKKLFITTGATEPFKALINLSVSKSFLYYLVSRNFTHLAIQHAGNLPENNGLKKDKKKANTNSSSKKNLEFFTYGALEIETFSFTSSIASEIDSADYVISHAGTGSILDSLRKSKPLLVAANPNLMDNHQIEIAERFEKMGVLKATTLSEGDYETLFAKLGSLIEESQSGNMKKLDSPDPAIFNTIISSEI